MAGERREEKRRVGVGNKKRNASFFFLPIRARILSPACSSMAYYWSASIVGVILLLLVAIWTNRNRFLHLLPASVRSRVRSYAPLSTFEDAAELGKLHFPLHSSAN